MKSRMTSSRKGQFLELCTLIIINLAIGLHGEHQEEYQPSPSLFQACPEIQGAPDFSPTKFQGRWVVAYHFHITTPPCQIISVSAPSEMEISFTSDMIIGSNLTIQGSGQGFALNPENPGSMMWNWNFLKAKFERVTVVGTDYDNYAVLIFCTNTGDYTQQAAVLWTRDHTAGPQYIEKARELSSTYVLLPFPMEVQDDCMKPVSFSTMQTLNLDVISQETLEMIFNFNVLRLGTHLVKK